MITDQKLAQLATRLKQQKDALKVFERDQGAIIDKLQSRIMTELERRGTKSITLDGGPTITRVQQEPTHHDYDKAVAALRRKPDVMDRIVTKVLNRAALESEVEAGNITPAELAKFQTVRPSKPYIVVS